MGLYESLRIDESDIGKTFGTRIQIGPMFSIRTDYGEKRRIAVCECACGRIEVVQRKHRVRTCHSCKAKTHGLSATPEFTIWQGMVRRCTAANAKDFHRYGGRGISVCDEWLGSFEKFYLYVGPRPTPKHEIDRFRDNDGNYEPGNVRWATRSENQRNKRRRVI